MTIVLTVKAWGTPKRPSILIIGENGKHLSHGKSMDVDTEMKILGSIIKKHLIDESGQKGFESDE